MENFEYEVSTGEGGAKAVLTLKDGKATLTHFIPITDGGTAVMPDIEISFERFPQEMILDPLSAGIVRSNGGTKLFYCPEGWQNGESFAVETRGEDIKQGIYLTSTNVVGEQKRHSLVLYYDRSAWHRVTTKGQITLDVAETLSSHLLADPELKTLGGIRLPSGRRATDSEVNNGAVLLLQRQSESRMPLILMAQRHAATKL
jgi:hypothetical protein